MNQAHIHPFYFPTDILLIDDDQDFLDLFSLRLDDEFNYLLFSSPQHALSHIKKSRYVPELITRWVGEHAIRLQHMDQSDVVIFDLPSFEDKLNNTERFQNVSIIVVDYTMPGMNGLDLCRELGTESHIKKILLTGQADESLAVEGFNGNIIDFFLRKDDPHIQVKLNQAVRSLQHAYFDSVNIELAAYPGLTADSCLNDSTFTDYFRIICDSHSIIEYYFLHHPKRFLLIDTQGNNHILRVFNQGDIQTQYEISSDQGAPVELLEKLASRKYVPAFQTSHGYFDPNIDWANQILSAEHIKGQQSWYCALDLNTQNDIPAHIVSYKQFRSSDEFGLRG